MEDLKKIQRRSQMLKIAKVSIAAFSVALILTLPCWAEPTVDELYGKEFGNNLALGKGGDLITGSDEHPGRGLAAWDIITDGDLCKSGANQCYTQVGAGGLQWIQLDLGEKMWIDTVVIWHWYIDSRVYNDTKTAVSETGNFSGEELVLFDSKKENTYAGTPEGHVLEFEPTLVRYIRDWANGSNVNVDAHWIEIAAFSVKGPGAVSPREKLATTWAQIKSSY